MTRSIPFTVTPNSVIVMLNGKTYALTQDSHQHYATIRQALKDKDFATVEKLIDLAQAINDFGGGKIKVVNGVVMYGTHELHNAATRRLLEQMNEGFDVEPMVKFLENVMQNPSKRAVDELYTFLEFNSLPITDDGHFVAYKRVNSDFKDFYTGKMDNSIGKVVEMPRNFVNDDKDQTCSAGLHFCSLSYLPHYHSGQGRIVIVKINPADVVSIPSDYNNAKGRACKYLILEEYAGDETTEKFSTSVYTPYAGEDADDDSEELSSDDYYDDFYDDSSSEDFDDEEGDKLVDCWSCSAAVLKSEISENDGLCPYCDAEIIDEEDEVTPEATVNVPTPVTPVKLDPAWPFPTGSVPAVKPASVANPAVAWPFPTGSAPTAPAAAPAQAKPQGVLYTKEQAAKLLGVSLDALRKRLDRGVSVQRVTVNGQDLVRIL
jgi:hypothetical protein